MARSVTDSFLPYTMPNTLSLGTFEPLVGQVVRVRFGDAAPSELTLIEASALGTDADPRRQRAPFRLTFRGPPGEVAPQAIYRVEHDALGELSIFLVPVRADANGVIHEAIFA